MDDLGKLATLLDDLEVRELIFGLAHVRSVAATAGAGAPQLRTVVLRLAETTSPEQYGSWLSDNAPNQAMTVDQVRLTIGDRALDDLAQLAEGSADAVAWQLASVLPDLVDAVTPGGAIIGVDRLTWELAQASADDDRSAGAFGSQVH
jgi:uncharacterized protein YidB (DUF937 family)